MSRLRRAACSRCLTRALQDTLIDLGEWLRRDHTTFLTCQYLLPDGSFQPRNIIVAGASALLSG